MIKESLNFTDASKSYTTGELEASSSRVFINKWIISKDVLTVDGLWVTQSQISLVAVLSGMIFLQHNLLLRQKEITWDKKDDATQAYYKWSWFSPFASRLHRVVFFCLILFLEPSYTSISGVPGRGVSGADAQPSECQVSFFRKLIAFFAHYFVLKS